MQTRVELVDDDRRAIVERAKNQPKQNQQPASARAFPIQLKIYRLSIPPLMSKFKSRAEQIPIDSGVYFFQNIEHFFINGLFFFGKFNVFPSVSNYSLVHSLEKINRTVIGIVAQ